MLDQESVSHLTPPDGQLYTATVSDFSGSDPLIYKEPLRTEQYDSKILNSEFSSFAALAGEFLSPGEPLAEHTEVLNRIQLTSFIMFSSGLCQDAGG